MIIILLLRFVCSFAYLFFIHTCTFLYVLSFFVNNCFLHLFEDWKHTYLKVVLKLFCYVLFVDNELAFWFFRMMLTLSPLADHFSFSNSIYWKNWNLMRITKCNWSQVKKMWFEFRNLQVCMNLQFIQGYE